MNKCYEVFISAETQEQADKILNTLIEKKLATGGQFLKLPARFLWKGEIAEMEYFTIMSFTTDEKKDALVAEVETISAEEVPMIRLLPIEVNAKLENWIASTLS
jgi:uncharacterized protein involved in tolerance to divalent cations